MLDDAATTVGDISSNNASALEIESAGETDVKKLIDAVNICEELEGFNETHIHMMMALVFITNFASNLDHGALPASITALSNDLNM